MQNCQSSGLKIYKILHRKVQCSLEMGKREYMFIVIFGVVDEWVNVDRSVTGLPCLQ